MIKFEVLQYYTSLILNARIVSASCTLPMGLYGSIKSSNVYFLSYRN